MSGALQGKVCLITGATSGIGRAIAEAFAAAGATLVLSGRDETRAQALLTELRAQGHEAHFIAGDQADPATAGRLAEATLALHGRIDVLVNNAAWAAWPGRTRWPRPWCSWRPTRPAS